MSKVIKQVVPVNDADHIIKFSGGISYIINAQGVGPQAQVEFWTHPTVLNNSYEEQSRVFRVFKEDDEIPAGYWLVGTTPRVGQTVFHLFEKRAVV